VIIKQLIVTTEGYSRHQSGSGYDMLTHGS